MVKHDFLRVSSLIFLSGLSLVRCVSQDIVEPTNTTANPVVSVKAGQRAAYVVLPGAQTYAVLKTPPLSGYYVVEVKLYERETDIGLLLAEDARRTGEHSFTMLSESFPVSELSGVRPRLSWWGDIWRGNDRPWLTPVRRDVHAVVVRRVNPSPSGFHEQSCPVLIFGNENELYTITSSGSDRHVIDLIQITAGLRSRNQAEIVVKGTCVTPEIDPLKSLLPHERSGRVELGSRGSKIVWSKIETIAEF